MPKCHATTVWEDWDGPTSDNGKGGGVASLNHYSKGAVCQWVFEVMCGIHVDKKNHFIIAPRPGGHFTHANLSYASVYGKVSCGWKKEENGYTYSIHIPENSTATLQLSFEKELAPGDYTYHEKRK